MNEKFRFNKYLFNFGVMIDLFNQIKIINIVYSKNYIEYFN